MLNAYGAQGFTNEDAANLLATLCQLPAVGFMQEPPGLQTLWFELAALPSASPKLWMDAYLAALAILHEAKFVTLDGGFRTFRQDGMKLMLLGEK